MQLLTRVSGLVIIALTGLAGLLLLPASRDTSAQGVNSPTRIAQVGQGGAIVVGLGSGGGGAVDQNQDEGTGGAAASVVSTISAGNPFTSTGDAGAAAAADSGAGSVGDAQTGNNKASPSGDLGPKADDKGQIDDLALSKSLGGEKTRPGDKHKQAFRWGDGRERDKPKSKARHSSHGSNDQKARHEKAHEQAPHWSDPGDEGRKKSRADKTNHGSSKNKAKSNERSRRSDDHKNKRGNEARKRHNSW